MLLIDGVKYELWDPTSEDEFESLVKEHTQEIFGEQSIYFDIKQKLKSLAGIGSIPDGLAITLGSQPELHVVEYELSNHDVFNHIISQVGKFISGLANWQTQQKIRQALLELVKEDIIANSMIKNASKSGEVHALITEVVEKKATLTIIIEHETTELQEAISAFSYPNIKKINIVAFQTFNRVHVGLAVHGHIFIPLDLTDKIIITSNKTNKSNLDLDKNPPITATKGTNLKTLMGKGIIQPGQEIFNVYKNKKYEAIVQPDGSIKLKHDSSIFPSLSSAASSITGTSINGWIWWQTKGNDDKILLLDNYRK